MDHITHEAIMELEN